MSVTGLISKLFHILATYSVGFLFVFYFVLQGIVNFTVFAPHSWNILLVISFHLMIWPSPPACHSFTKLLAPQRIFTWLQFLFLVAAFEQLKKWGASCTSNEQQLGGSSVIVRSHLSVIFVTHPVLPLREDESLCSVNEVAHLLWLIMH